MINRFGGQHTRLDLVEGTFKMFKIETRKIMSPLKLFINYGGGSAALRDATKQIGSKADRDLRIIYSQSNPKPELNNCDGSVENVSCLTVYAPKDERFFSKEFLYLKFETIAGQQAKLKLEFPKQDAYDAKLKKYQLQMKQNQIPGSKAKNAIQREIEQQIAKFILEPRLYENFLTTYNLQKRQKSERLALELQQKRSETCQQVDFVSKNMEIGSTFIEQKQQRQMTLHQASLYQHEVKNRRKV